ncbi:MAG: peptidoglycan DD-metalloendopeptidase family protein [Anaerolineaceae bacterium]|nr:peptidoglycan DD-metalloendopeptidase family protein [Anaerolineaceae bacterium]
MMSKKISYVILILVLLFPTQRSFAQDQQPNGPVYIVQPGDTLGLIAFRFGVTVNDLISANNITNPNSITAGTQLTIPGLQGITGTLVTTTIPLSENLRSLSLRYQIPQDLLSHLNRITSPSEIYAGANLILPQAGSNKYYLPEAVLSSDQTILDVAISQNSSPWAVATTNMLTNTWDILPGENLYALNQSDNTEVSSISPLVTSATISPMPLTQGNTEIIRLVTKQPMDLSGSLDGSDLHFFQDAPDSYVALQGVYAIADTGLAPLILKGSQGDTQLFNLEQNLLLQAGNFIKDPPLTVDPETIDPAITGPEDSKVAALTKPATPTKYWTKLFSHPLDGPIFQCVEAGYGDRRSYNGGPYNAFHAGIDFAACASNLNIYAAAPGKVVYTGLQVVRGNTTIIDHGWGVYTCYYHQSQILVKVGDMVQQGQMIGQIGATGRVTGPHLHFEVWVNGFQVSPTAWLTNVFP